MFPGARSKGDILLGKFRVSTPGTVQRKQTSMSPVVTYFSLPPTLSHLPCDNEQVYGARGSGSTEVRFSPYCGQFGPMLS